jgi:hypothetical protein
MPIKYDTPYHCLPAECREQVEAATAKVAGKLHERLSIPVPGNPSGGFPGLNLQQHKQNVIRARRAAIDKWNKDNPNSEPLAHTPAPPPADLSNVKPKFARREVPKSDPHVEAFLSAAPDHRRDELRAFIEHERELEHDDRARLQDEIKKKGLDPHDIEHRLQHHKEATADAGQSDANNSETPNA